MTQTSAFHFESLVWDWPIAIYLFLIGISAGLVTLAVLLRRVYPQAGGADSTLLRTTLIVGPGAVILGLLILVFHLTRPWTFWKLMFHYSFTSVMSMGVMLFQLYMVVLVLWLAKIFEHDLLALQQRWLPKLGIVQKVLSLLTPVHRGLETLMLVLAVLLGVEFYSPESIEIFIGMVMLLGIAITHDLRHRDENDIDASGMSVFEERTSRIIKNLPYIAIVGALIAAVASMKIFAGSEVSIFTLEKAYSAGVTPEQSQTLINQAALAEFMRGLGFVPLIATTALATGVYAVAGFTFVYAVGYLSPNLMVAAVLGAVVISAEVLLLRSIGKWLGRYPSVRNASDNIRNAMNMLMEVALLVGSIFAAIKMAGYTGFSIAVAIYFLNESLGRPVQKMAAPVVAVMITGILLNVLYWLGLFVPAE